MCKYEYRKWKDNIWSCHREAVNSYSWLKSHYSILKLGMKYKNVEATTTVESTVASEWYNWGIWGVAVSSSIK